MRYTNATWIPGPWNNMGYGGITTYPKTGIVCHSAEGYFGVGNRPRDLMIARGVSWHFTVYIDGHVEQHYETDAILYHAANVKANKLLIGIEHEGVKGQPLTQSQLDASVELVRWLCSNLFNGAMQRGATLYEHNEVWNWESPNAGLTTCPNNRIPWEYYIPEVVEDKMTDQEKADFNQLKQQVDLLVGRVTTLEENYKKDPSKNPFA